MAWKPAYAIFCLALASGPAMAMAELPEGAVLVEAGNWRPSETVTRADAATVLARIAVGEADTALALMHGWEDPVRFELAAVLVVDQLQQGPETSAVRTVLESLAREPVRLFRRHEETAADWFKPLFDIGARAASALELLDFVRARDAMVIALRDDPLALPGKHAKASVVASAIDRLDPAALARLGELALAGQVPLASEAWVALARNSPTEAVLEKVAEVAAPLDLLPLIPELARNLPPPAATAWLERRAADPELASAAVLALGAVAPKYAPAEAALARHLGDPRTGASAAAAFARMEGVDRVARIDALLAGAKRAEVVRDLALALRLEGSAAARERLERLAGDPRLPASAKAEWLR